MLEDHDLAASLSTYNVPGEDGVRLSWLQFSDPTDRVIELEREVAFPSAKLATAWTLTSDCRTDGALPRSAATPTTGCGSNGCNKIGSGPLPSNS